MRGRFGFGIGEEGAGAMAGADILMCSNDAGEWSCDDRYFLFTASSSLRIRKYKFTPVRLCFLKQISSNT